MRPWGLPTIYFLLNLKSTPAPNGSMLLIFNRARGPAHIIVTNQGCGRAGNLANGARVCVHARLFGGTTT